MPSIQRAQSAPDALHVYLCSRISSHPKVNRLIRRSIQFGTSFSPITNFLLSLVPLPFQIVLRKICVRLKRSDNLFCKFGNSSWSSSRNDQLLKAVWKTVENLGRKCHFRRFSTTDPFLNIGRFQTYFHLLSNFLTSLHFSQVDLHDFLCMNVLGPTSTKNWENKATAVRIPKMEHTLKRDQTQKQQVWIFRTCYASLLEFRYLWYPT